MTSYMRRKALAAAYGAHVNDWRTWRWKGWRAASLARAEAREAAWLAGAPAREAREREWSEAIAALRAGMLELSVRRNVCEVVPGDYGDLWVE